MPFDMCIPVISFFAGVWAQLGLLVYTGPIAWIISGIALLVNNGISLTVLIINAALTSIALFILIKFLGKAGPILLIILGIVGVPFSYGTTLILTIIGIIMWKLPKFLPLMIAGNLVIYLLAALCYATV